MTILLYSTWLDTWVKTYKKPRVKNLSTITGHIRLHVPKWLKEKRVGKITPQDITRALEEVERSRTRVDIYDIYNGSLNVAFQLGMITRNPCALVPKPKHKRIIGAAIRKGLELDDFRKRIEGARAELFFLFCLYTGARRSEALSVQWSDVDFDERSIHIRGTKTEASDRYVPMFAECEDVLRRIPRNGDKLFHHRRDYVTKAFKKYCPEHKLHDLRHTFATTCFYCGVEVVTVSQWLGHSDLRTTRFTYIHLLRLWKSEINKVKFS